MQSEHMKRQGYEMEYVKSVESGQRSFGQNNRHTIIFVVGGVSYLQAEEKHEVCMMEDLIFIKPGNRIKLEYRKNKYPLELYVLYIGSDLLQVLSDEHTDLNASFDVVPFQVKMVHAESEGAMLIKNISKKLYAMATEEQKFAHALYEKSLLCMLLILALRSSVQEDRQHKVNKKKHVVMDDIFIYIKEHLTEDITLERLEDEFYVSRYHIVREFKKMTGETPHAYIVKARLDLCRRYIEQGKSIREVYELGGFGGYNHFFRAFKKEYGVTPMQYYKNLQIDRSVDEKSRIS